MPTLASAVLIVAVSLVGAGLAKLSPTIRAAGNANRAAAATKMERASYAENQRWNRKWGPLYLVVLFVIVLPFCITSAFQPVAEVVGKSLLVLIVYDFAYYLMHRFAFHNSALLGGRFQRIHSVHHRQHNPCRSDSSYIHPVEVALGLGLYTLTVAVLALVLGRFDVTTIVITFVAFSQINLHNHSLWETDRFPFRYLNYASKLHHAHHARFDGGNFATISPLFDWMFGTLDHGHPRKKAGTERPST